MTARMPSTGQAAPAVPELGASGRPSSSTVNPAEVRVVSISPSAACVEVKPLPEVEAPRGRQEMLDTIEVSLIDELRTMLADARPRIDELRELLDHSVRQRESARETSSQLHERLRLGARMLQAFGAQMNRVESEMGRAQDQRARLEKTNEAAGVRIEAAMRNAAERIERTARHALAAMEERVKTLEARL